MVMIMATDRLRQTLNVGKLPLFEALGVRKIGAGLLVLGRVRSLNCWSVLIIWAKGESWPLSDGGATDDASMPPRILLVPLILKPVFGSALLRIDCR